jgi:hypothetical protein
MTQTHWFGFIAILLGLAGCGLHTETTPLNTPPRPLTRRAPESVAVLSTPPTQEHVAVALVEVEPESSVGQQQTDEMLAEARKKAGELGCDALLVHGVQSRGPGPDAVLFDSTLDRKGLVASCLVYKPPSAPARIGLSVRE